jgi:hypothetical protein
MQSLKDAFPDPTRLEVLLLVVACAFVYFSIPRQMKNFFVWGMIFVAVGIVDLQNDFFKDSRTWLLSLLTSGFLIMIMATHYAGVRMAVARWIKGWRL